LEVKENYYWKQFTAMEQAIQKSNSQSGWLTQQMGGGM
jgi:flagellar hook-associated protein 2